MRSWTLPHSEMLSRASLQVSTLAVLDELTKTTYMSSESAAIVVSANSAGTCPS